MNGATRWLGWAGVGLGSALAIAALALACSTSSGGSSSECNANPFQCAATGQTCWVKDCTCTTPQCDVSTCTPHFACMQSVANKQVGAPCNDVPSDVQCGDNQGCIQITADQDGGLCFSYCDPNDPAHGCPSSFACVEYAVGKPGNPTVHVCAPLKVDAGPPSMDASTEGGKFDAAGIDAAEGDALPM